jgi:hypothetical protein
VDEYRLLGFSAWRSACRAAGFSLPSMLSFAWQLLPNAILGALAGGFALLLTGFLLRHDHGAARACAASHLGCVLAMPVGLAICTLALPAGVMLVAELALTLLLALLLVRVLDSGVRRNP